MNDLNNISIIIIDNNILFSFKDRIKNIINRCANKKIIQYPKHIKEMHLNDYLTLIRKVNRKSTSKKLKKLNNW